VTNRRARRAIERHGGQVLGEQYAPLGTRDFTPLLEEIEQRGADLVVSTFVGADEVAFERQFYEAGLRDRCSTIALALDEATNQHIGASAANGLWSAFHYFEHLRTPENAAFLRRYRERFGNVQPPVSSISESIYEAVKRIGASARAARSIEPLAMGRELRTVQFDSPRAFGHGACSSEPPMLLAESIGGELLIRDSLTH
ncbi:MAG: ABC transporter substrate-binding protein, partial [Steroidobacteraceae bacterium]